MVALTPIFGMAHPCASTWPMCSVEGIIARLRLWPLRGLLGEPVGFRREAGPVLLGLSQRSSLGAQSDQFAPVDNLMAEVFRNRYKSKDE